MFSVTITDQTGQRTQKTFNKTDVSIGRDKANDIVLLRGNVSKKHARILVNRGSYMVIDNKSTNGTFVNGERIKSPYVLGAADKVFIGDFVLEVLQDGAAAALANAGSEPEAQNPKAAPKQNQSRSPVAVSWDDDWSSPMAIDDNGADGPTMEEVDEEDEDLSFDADDEMHDSEPEEEDLDGETHGVAPAYTSPEAAYDNALALAIESLREYVDLDAHYRVHALGYDCDCGGCLLCRARAALADLEAAHEEY